MKYQTITSEREDAVVTVTLKRPEAQNRIDERMARELSDVAQAVRDDDGVLVLVLQGEGGVFCAGLEPEALSSEGPSLTASVTSVLASLDRVLIAAMDGDCIGAGLDLALVCDIRLATPRSRFGFPEVSQGTIPSGGGTQRLPRIVGRGAALALLLLAETIEADEAFRIGLVNRVVPDLPTGQAGLQPAVRELTGVLCSRGPIALRYAKEAIAKGLDMTLDQGLRLEGDLNFLLQTTADRAEGVRAFLEKRLPKFHGS